MADRDIWDELPERGAFLAFALYVGTVVLVVAFLVALWVGRAALLLFFAGIIVAAILLGVARPLKAMGVPHRLAVTLALFAVVGGIVGAGIAVAPTLAPQIAQLTEIVPAVVADIDDRLSLSGDDGGVGPAMSSIAALAARWSGAAAGAATGFVLAVLAGFFLALAPDAYRRGAIRLFPRRLQPSVEEALSLAGHGVRAWLRGQVVAMVVVGGGVALGAWAIGLPAPLALGLIAGLLEFVPVVGPIVASIPGLLLALTVGPTVLFWTGTLYLVLQQLEANVLMPLVERQVADVPPAVYLVAIVGLGALFGPVGVILSAPLMIIAYLWLDRFWIRPVNDEI